MSNQLSKLTEEQKKNLFDAYKQGKFNAFMFADGIDPEILCNPEVVEPTTNLKAIHH